FSFSEFSPSRGRQILSPRLPDHRRWFFILGVFPIEGQANPLAPTDPPQGGFFILGVFPIEGQANPLAPTNPPQGGFFILGVFPIEGQANPLAPTT
ncbi:MAG TPA: hypothetical protein PLY85_00300, partial [Anaerolineaceae bacterium]|nr:hypothetical protein [Anaerolineaceae bacterium]